jgi:hypothetical protein
MGRQDSAILKIARLFEFRTAPFPQHGFFAVGHLRGIGWLSLCDSQIAFVRSSTHSGLQLPVRSVFVKAYPRSSFRYEIDSSGILHATTIENQYPQVVISLTAYTRSAISHQHPIAVEEL